MGDDKMECPFCGEYITNGDFICPNCGADLTPYYDDEFLYEN